MGEHSDQEMLGTECPCYKEILEQKWTTPGDCCDFLGPLRSLKEFKLRNEALSAALVSAKADAVTAQQDLAKARTDLEREKQESATIRQDRATLLAKIQQLEQELQPYRVKQVAEQVRLLEMAQREPYPVCVLFVGDRVAETLRDRYQLWEELGGWGVWGGLRTKPNQSVESAITFINLRMEEYKEKDVRFHVIAMLGAAEIEKAEKSGDALGKVASDIIGPLGKLRTRFPQQILSVTWWTMLEPPDNRSVARINDLIINSAEVRKGDVACQDVRILSGRDKFLSKPETGNCTQYSEAGNLTILSILKDSIFRLTNLGDEKREEINRRKAELLEKREIRTKEREARQEAERKANLSAATRAKQVEKERNALRLNELKVKEQEVIIRKLQDKQRREEDRRGRDLPSTSGYRPYKRGRHPSSDKKGSSKSDRKSSTSSDRHHHRHHRHDKDKHSS